MDNLLAFMSENAVKAAPVEYVASKRFHDASGNPLAWKIQPITDATNSKLIKECQRKEYAPGTREVRLHTDQAAYAAKVICACVTFPDLNNADLQSSYGAIGAEDLLGKMLLPGEATDLFLAVQEINGFQAGMDEKVKRAKN